MNKFSFDYETLSKDYLTVKVRFNDGRIYVLNFLSPKFISKQLDKTKSHCLPIPALIPIEPVSIEKVKEVLEDIYHSGYFDHLMPEKGGE